MLGRIITASLAAYGFVRLRFPGRNILFIVMLATMMVPGHVTMIPLYIIFKSLKTFDPYWPLVLPVWFGGGAFFIYLLRQFINSIPADYDDAARIDGCSWLGVYWRIILPMIKPGPRRSRHLLLHGQLERLHGAADLPQLDGQIDDLHRIAFLQKRRQPRRASALESGDGRLAGGYGAAPPSLLLCATILYSGHRRFRHKGLASPSCHC